MLTLSISKAAGGVWLLCTPLFIVVGVLFLMKIEWWWMRATTPG